VKIYKLSAFEEKSIKFECTETGMYLVGDFVNGEIYEYRVYGADNSFFDSFENFFHATNWVRKHVDKRFNPTKRGVRIARGTHWKRLAYLSGEWWIIDGSAHFADGDIGEFNHEAYAIRYAQDMLMDGQEDWESWKPSKALDLFSEIKSNYDEDSHYEMLSEAESDPEGFIMKHLDESEIDDDTFFVANGNSQDPRKWSMKTLGWKRLAGNSITTWTLSSSDLESIKSGIWDAFSDSESLDGEKFDIEVASNNKMFWGVPMGVIESVDLSQLNYYMSRSQWGAMASVHGAKIFKKANELKNLWLDDLRPMPSGFDIWAKTVEDAQKYILEGNIGFISFDNDLAQEKEGRHLATWIEELAFNGEIQKIGWKVHSANPIGAKSIEQAMTNADRFWSEKK